VVKVGDWDVEACAGTHLKSTVEIGFIKIIHSERVQDGVERLSYSIGLSGVKTVQQSETLLVKIAETLNAPIEKLDQTTEKLARELKEGNAERRRLIKELAAKETTNVQTGATEKAEEINGVKLVLRDFSESIDVERMVQTANELIKADEAIVTVFYGSDGKNARIIIMAGKIAIDKGANAGDIVREVSTIIGGGGGGKPNFAQGGGTTTEKLAEAIKKAKEALSKQLKP
jgi:alanyl-tRNA synthetase